MLGDAGFGRAGRRIQFPQSHLTTDSWIIEVMVPNEEPRSDFRRRIVSRLDQREDSVNV